MRNLKKVIALVAVFAMMVSTVAFAQSFSDVDVEHDYYEAIEMLSNLDILTGDDADGDGTMDFRAEDKITRAEVATIISRIQGINSVAQVATDFVDVPSTHWASGYVAQAAGQGIVNGYGDGNFGPEDNVLYEQAIKMLVVTLGYTPFADANGGYPTGHLMAAQRFGIVDGVIGASTGVEATRGQIAQLVYNAIDTPLMDSATYGANAEYVIYDDMPDGDYPFTTLLTRDLGVKKFSGWVTANQVTDLDAYKPIDTEEDATVVVTDDDSKTNDYYEYDEDDVLYAGESGIDALIGKHVTGYAKEAGRNNEYVVIAAAETTKNSTLTIGLDKFVDYDTTTDKIEYWKNDSDRTTTFVDVKDDAAMLLNGVAVADGEKAGIIAALKADKAWSGEITLIDNDSDKDYAIVAIEVGTPVVVDEVSANGKVSLKNASAKTIDNDRITLVFDEENTEQIIKLTKGGVEIDYTELAEWDVLSVLANKNNDYIVAEVIEEGKIEGAISSEKASTTSAVSKKYTIDGNAYDVAKYAYECDALKPGSEGVFYIDGFGKIVAYSKTGSTVASDKYAFIIKAKAVSDGWDGTAIKVELLDKSGEVYTAYLADKVEILNKDKEEFIKEAKLASYTSTSYKAEDIDRSLFEALVKNAFVTYEANSAGEIKALTFAQTDADANELYHEAGKHAGSAEYDAEDGYVKIGTKKFDVDEDTLVFYMFNGTDGDVATNGAIANDSKVDTIASLNSGTYTTAYLYDAQDTVSVMVLYNTKGNLDKSTNIALIDSVGKAVVGDEIVDSVTFFKDGEKFTANTDVDYNGATLTAGNAYKLSLSADGTTITDAILYGEFAARVKDTDEDGAVAFKNYTTGDEKAYFGPVVGYVSSKDVIRFAPATAPTTNFTTSTTYNFATYETIKAVDANVYVIDPVRTTNKISVGYASDVDFDEEIIDAAATGKKVDFPTADDAFDVATTNDALGMMDFVVAFEYDDEITDVIIIKAYDFGNKWQIAE